MSVSGVYKFQSHVNFDGFLKALGIPDEKVNEIMSLQSALTVTQNGDNYSIATPRTNLQFTLGKEANFDLPTGDTAKTVFTKEGNKLVAKNVTTKGREFSFVLEFNGDTLTSNFTDKQGHKFTRIYKK